jgi:mycothiol synthase
VEAVPCTSSSIDAVVAACTAADGRSPLSEHKLQVVNGAADGAYHCWGKGATQVVAVAARHRHAGDTEHWAIEVAVAPDARGDEADAIRFAAALVPGDARHTLWASRPSQQEAARALGYRAFRHLLLMECALPAPPPVAAAGYRIRPFRPGTDETEVAVVNNRAFSTHRENDAMTADEIRSRQRAAWFDADGFLVAEVGDGSIAGLCWTKVHPGGEGEIYIIGVDPAHHGRGLGRWLLLAGLDHLHRRRGASVAQLWTDGDNPAVDRLHRPLGFETVLVNEEMRCE